MKEVGVLIRQIHISFHTFKKFIADSLKTKKRLISSHTQERDTLHVAIETERKKIVRNISDVKSIMYHIQPN